jgi:hypothetical protein
MTSESCQTTVEHECAPSLSAAEVASVEHGCAMASELAAEVATVERVTVYPRT